MKNQEIIQKKTEIRKEIRSKLKALPESELKTKSEAICQKLLASLEIQTTESIAFFVPLKTESDIMPLLENCLSKGKRCFVPRVIDGEHMVFHLLDNNRPLIEQLESGAFGILEPKLDLPVVNVDEMLSEELLVLVPAMAFAKTDDGKYARLGKGKGYYDRFFAALDSKVRSCNEPCCAGVNSAELSCKRLSYKTLGVAFSFQLIEEIPVDKFDFSIDNIITD